MIAWESVINARTKLSNMIESQRKCFVCPEKHGMKERTNENNIIHETVPEC